MPRPAIAQEIIDTLQLTPHPEEGGYFAETWRCEERVGTLPVRYVGPRSVGTAIYYLLTPDTYSHLHRLKSDEIFHLYMGGPVQMLQLHPDGRDEQIIIGTDLAAGQRPQVLAPRGSWQGSRLMEGADFALLGCTVAPGFDYVDYEHAVRAELVDRYPEVIDEIINLTSAGD